MGHRPAGLDRSGLDVTRLPPLAWVAGWPLPGSSGAMGPGRSAGSISCNPDDTRSSSTARSPYWAGWALPRCSTGSDPSRLGSIAGSARGRSWPVLDYLVPPLVDSLAMNLGDPLPTLTRLVNPTLAESLRRLPEPPEPFLSSRPTPAAVGD